MSVPRGPFAQAGIPRRASQSTDCSWLSVRGERPAQSRERPWRAAKRRSLCMQDDTALMAVPNGNGMATLPARRGGARAGAPSRLMGRNPPTSGCSFWWPAEIYRAIVRRLAAARAPSEDRATGGCKTAKCVLLGKAALYGGVRSVHALASHEVRAKRRPDGLFDGGLPSRPLFSWSLDQKVTTAGRVIQNVTPLLSCAFSRWARRRRTRCGHKAPSFRDAACSDCVPCAVPTKTLTRICRYISNVSFSHHNPPSFGVYCASGGIEGWGGCYCSAARSVCPDACQRGRGPRCLLLVLATPPFRLQSARTRPRSLPAHRSAVETGGACTSLVIAVFTNP